MDAADKVALGVGRRTGGEEGEGSSTTTKAEGVAETAGESLGEKAGVVVMPGEDEGEAATVLPPLLLAAAVAVEVSDGLGLGVKVAPEPSESYASARSKR